MNQKRKKKINAGSVIEKILTAIAIIAIMFFFILPIVWMLSTSLKSTVDIISQPPKILFKPVFNWYQSVLTDKAILKSCLNSLISTGVTLIIAFIVGIPGAYALARYDFVGKRFIMLWILVGLMIPLVSLIIPFYIMFKKVGLLDTHIGLIIVYLLIDIPFVVWMMGINFKQVPLEIDEAASLDGCNMIQKLILVLMPITKPGMASAAISCVIATWNEFLFAMVLTQTKAKTAPVVISGYMSTSGTNWGEMAAVAALLMLPPAIFGIAIQKSYIRGLTAGAVKS